MVPLDDNDTRTGLPNDLTVQRLENIVYFNMNRTINSEAIISVYDVQGRVVHVENMHVINGSGSLNVDVSNFQHGIYLLKITIGDTTLVGKIVR